MKKMLYLTWVVGALLVSFSSTLAQSNRHWDFAPDGFNIPQGQLMQAQFPKEYKLARLNVPALYQELSDAHRRPADAPPLLISIPNPEGGYSEFFISPTTVVADEVAHLYTVKTFKGYAKNSRQVSIRCDISPTGFHAAVFSSDITYVIEPASRSDVNAHIVYYKSDLEVPGFRCGVDDTHRRSGYKPSDSGTPKTPANLRTYRLAIIADATYRTQFGGMPYMAANVLNSFASGINMVNAVYERDLGVHLTLVSNTTCADAVLTDHTDIDEVHTFIATSSGLGSGGFDVGHSLLWANTGGVAYLGVVCNNSLKGGGFSGSNGSVTQLYVDYMAHELGHQFGADHTFASSECGTSEPNFRYETGEGSTIMAYAGVCGAAPSYQNFSDPYFHAASIGQINSYISTGGTCAAISTPGTGNNAAPTANAQSDITIPKQTPFILVGVGSDANSDPVTFSWEQFNGSGGATTGSPNCNTTTQPLFRFRPPTSNNYRVFPQMSDVLAGNNNTPAWEKLPCVARTLNFRMTARDNNTNWGRTANDNMVVTVADTGPFNVTAPNGGESWATSSTQNVTWTVNGTDAHCPNVDVLISTDNGVTYTVLGTFPNNGSASVTMPGTASATARVLVQCSVGGNFRSASTFFDVSNAVFAITEPAPCPGLRISQVYGGGGNTYTHDYVELYNGGSTAVSLNGLSIQYTSATGTGNFGASTTQLTELPNVMIQPGRYFLVQQANGTTTNALPTPDHIDPTPINLSATGGKVALVNSVTGLGCNGGSTPCNVTQLALIIDLVGYGTANFFEGTGPAPTPSNTTAILRTGNGCTDNNNNSADFVTGTPNPRNSASPVNTCGLVLTITDNVCPSTTGTISGSGCLGGTVLEYATNEAGPWTTTAPTYTTSPITVYVRCRNTTTNCSGPVVSGTTAPTVCPTCPDLSTAPGEVQITNSACGTGCTVTSGSIAAPTMGCPTGSSIQYNVNGGGWTSTLPTYAAGLTIQTRCLCDTDANTAGPASTGVMTNPGTCDTPTAAVISGTGFFCFEGNTGNAPVVVNITGGAGPFTVVINDGVTNFTVNNYTSGSNINRAVYGTSTYTLVSVTDANGCAVPVGSLSGSATMTQSPDDIEITGIEVQPSCAMPNGGSITLTITGGIAPYTFAWSNNETTQDLTNLGPGDYDVMVTDRGGCEAFETFTLDPPAGCCPVLSSAPGEVQITNSTCGTGCAVTGGSIAAPTMGCPTGSSIQYNVNNGGWTSTLPTYADGLTIQTRCLCDTDANTFGPASTGVTTAPGTCVTPDAPTGALAITNSICTACAVSGGIIALGTVSGTGGTLEYSTDGGQNWSATLPTYNQTGPAQTIIASVLGANGCRSNTTQVGVTAPGTCVTPDAPTGALAITNSTCTACAVSGGIIALGTVSGTGGTLQYSTDGGQNWSATLPTYNQTGPAQTIIASVLGANGCRSNTATVGTTAPGACTTPGTPTLTITNNVCPTTPGTIVATGCGAGTVLEYATNASGPWSTMAPTYTTTAFTVYARCRNTTTDCVSSTVSEATQPVLCPTPCGNAYWNMTTEPVTTNTVANTSFGAIGRGNNNGTTTLITTASVSSGYLGASGGGNAGAAARIGALNTGANGSAYFEVVVTPDAGTVFTLNGISFGSRSTGTGPLAYSIRTSANNYATEVAGGTLLSNSVWALQSNTGLSVASGAGQPLTIRVYGYNGTGSPGTGTANWRIDDLTISGCNDPSLCPALSVAPGEVQIINSTCGTGCTASGGSIAAPTTGCPSGSSIQYSTNGGQSWSTTLPAYNQTGPAQTIQTRCLCDTDANTFSQASAGVTTAPPVCSQPLNITCVNGSVNFNGQSSIALTPAALVQIIGGCQIQSITANPASILCTQVGQTVPVIITVTDQGGITSTCTSQITVSGLPCNWQSANVNCNEAANNVAFNTATGQWTITSSNCYYDSPFTTDENVFARRQLCGDGSITALVTGMNPLAGGWAGVIMRETNDAGAKKAQLVTNLSSLHRREFRVATNGQSFPQQFASSSRYWLRIVRAGNQFTMYTSPNGTAWYVVGSQNITMQSCIQVGLVATNSTANGTVTATFSNVGFTQVNPPSVNNADVQATLGQIEFDVFPNPTSGQLNIDLTQYAGKPVRIEMYSLEGKLLKFTEMDEVQTTVETLDLSQLQRGMYLVRVKSEGLPDATRKVVLNR